MKIIQLSAENVKRLRAVEITPDGTVQIVAGNNAAGKSSVLDAIWLALGGKAASKTVAHPIRDGEDHASVTLDLGDLVVERKWQVDSSAAGTLTVRDKDGERMRSPQTVLDDLIGRMSFDPLEFTRLSPAAQRDTLLGIVELPFDPDELAAKRKHAFDERTDVGRARKGIGALQQVDPDLPEDETSASEILAHIREAQAVVDEAAARERYVLSIQSQIDAKTAEANRLMEELSDLGAQMDGAVKAAQLGFGVTTAAAVEELERQLANVEFTNTAIRANNDARAIAASYEEMTKHYDMLSKAIESLDEEKAEGLAAAEMPIEGLGFDDDGVTYGGVPFQDTSSAEQIKVSMALAMASNPGIRVLRIMDGSLLDDDSMKLIYEAATYNDFQVWVERVGNDGGPGVVVIEDGAVREGIVMHAEPVSPGEGFIPDDKPGPAAGVLRTVAGTVAVSDAPVDPFATGA